MRNRQRGYTLIEALVALAITVVVITAVLGLFDFHRQVARVESERSEMQQAMRAVHLEVAKTIREAGRGGLAQNSPDRTLPDLGVAVEVATNVEDGEREVAPAEADSPVAVEGTDILTLRGVFTGQIYRGSNNDGSSTFLVLRDAGGSVVSDPRNARQGEIHVCAVSPAGFPQPLQPLRAALANGGSQEALVLVGASGEAAYAVVQLDPASSAPTSSQCNPGDPDAGVTLAFVVEGSTRANLYQELSGASTGLPRTLTNVSALGVLEEYRYYLREVREIQGEDGSRLIPFLSRARLYPNTGLAWGTDASARKSNLRQDIADGLLDFQVSLAFDTTQGGGALANGSLDPDGDPTHESEDGRDDDWLFNSADDDPASAVWAHPGAAIITKPWLRADLFYIRLSTVGWAGHPVGNYEAPLLEELEDRTYDGSSPDDPDSDWFRQFHRWLLTTTIDVRNL